MTHSVARRQEKDEPPSFFLLLSLLKRRNMPHQKTLSLFQALTAFINISGWTFFSLAVFTVYIFGQKLRNYSIFVVAVACVPVLLLMIWNLLYAAITDPA